MATSPDLPNLIVVGDTIDEVLALAPQVASVLPTSMEATDGSLPKTIRAAPPISSTVHILVPA